MPARSKTPYTSDYSSEEEEDEEQSDDELLESRSSSRRRSTSGSGTGGGRRRSRSSAGRGSKSSWLPHEDELLTRWGGGAAEQGSRGPGQRGGWSTSGPTALQPPSAATGSRPP